MLIFRLTSDIVTALNLRFRYRHFDFLPNLLSFPSNLFELIHYFATILILVILELLD